MFCPHKYFNCPIVKNILMLLLNSLLNWLLFFYEFQDLVKSHLMFAVREEVEVLKEKIAELMVRLSSNNIILFIKRHVQRTKLLKNFWYDFYRSASASSSTKIQSSEQTPPSRRFPNSKEDPTTPLQTTHHNSTLNLL